MTNNKEKFNEMLNKFYANGLLTEVYATENTKVCNAFNQFYVAFNMDMVAEFPDQFPGIKMGSSAFKDVVNDERYALAYFGALSPESQKKAILPLDDKLFTFWMANKAEFASRPPKVDLEFEQQVIEWQRKQGELASMLDEQQAQRLAAAQQKGVPSQK